MLGITQADPSSVRRLNESKFVPRRCLSHLGPCTDLEIDSGPEVVRAWARFFCSISETEKQKQNIETDTDSLKRFNESESVSSDLTPEEQSEEHTKIVGKGDRKRVVSGCVEG